MSGKGKSVVDYILTSNDALSTSKYFDTISCNEFVSKHELSNLVGGHSKIPDKSILILDVELNSYPMVGPT